MSVFFESTPLSAERIIGGFNCGKQSLNDWLTHQAHRAQTGGHARVQVWSQLGEQKVCAYYAVCPTEIVRSEDGVPAGAAGGYSRISGFLIARLALDTSLQGAGYGEQLLLDAVGVAVAAAEIGGGRLIVVDAVDDEAKRFYQRYGFTPVRDRERRLVLKMSTAAKALGERWN